VRGAERVAHDERVAVGEHVEREQMVAERLRHLLVADRDQAVVHPVARERVARRGRLGNSFSWCGKRRSMPPPWMSKEAPR
jgi:hypothetical protein